MHEQFFQDTERFVPRDVMKPTDGLRRFLQFAESLDAEVLWSLKLNGARVIILVHEDGQVFYFSRAKKLFPNYGRFDLNMRHLAARAAGMGFSPYPVVFDGEMTSQDGKDFSKLMTQLHRHKEIDPSVFRLHLFDLWMWNTSLRKRLKALDLLLDLPREISRGFRDIQVIRHLPIPREARNYEFCIDLVNAAKAQGIEGCVFKLADSYYENKNTRLWCRVKDQDGKPMTEDLAVVGVNISKSGMWKGLVCSLIVDRSGVKISVPGLELEDKKRFLTDPPKLVEIEFSEILPSGSVRHPRYIRDRSDDKMEVSLNEAV